MAYCAKCGAYIPDGQTECLACGYDENAKKTESKAYNLGDAAADLGNAAGKAFQQAGIDTEKLRRQLEQQREQQRENNRKWAEAERTRRQQQEESRRRAEYESADRAGSATDYSSEVRGGINQTSRRLAAISYLGALWLVPMIFFREDKFAMYHAKQGIILTVASTLATALGSLLHLGWVATLLHVFLIIKGIGNANDGKTEALPYIGDIFSKF